MKSHLNATRAITAEFARQFIRPFLWVAISIIAGLLLIISLLAFNISQWWWLLAIPVVVIGLICMVMWITVRFIVNRISPQLNKEQRITTRNFIDKLRFVVEAARTPYPIIIFYVIRDIIMRKENGFIQEITTQSKALRPDYEELKKLF